MTNEEAISALEESQRQNRMMQKSPTTFFKSSDICEGTKNAGRRIEALGLAIAALRAQQEPNAPLTLDDLREMDGDPVWVCDPDGSDGLWALVDLEYELCRTAKGGLAIFDTYGKTWLAYRRKPEATP